MPHVAMPLQGYVALFSHGLSLEQTVKLLWRRTGNGRNKPSNSSVAAVASMRWRRYLPK
jgi:hypothetical protein